MLRQLSLRTRLVLGVLVLATAGLFAADAATYTSLRSFLVQRIDKTLDADEHSYDRGVGFGHGGDRDPGPGPGPAGAQSAVFVQYRATDGKTVLETRQSGSSGDANASSPP